MKKLFAAVSTFVVIGFAIALADADEMPTNLGGLNPPSVTTPDMPKNLDADRAAGDTQKLASPDQLKYPKTCTDSAGATYYPGKKGFSSCMDKMKKSAMPEQKSGIKGSESPSGVDNMIDPYSQPGSINR